MPDRVSVVVETAVTLYDPTCAAHDSPVLVTSTMSLVVKPAADGLAVVMTPVLTSTAVADCA